MPDPRRGPVGNRRRLAVDRNGETVRGKGGRGENEKDAKNEGGKVRYGFSAVSFGAGEGSSVGGVVGSADVSSVYYTYNYSQQYYYKNAYVGDGIKGIGEIAGYTEVPEDAYDTQSTRYATEEEMKQGDEYKEAYKNETD